MPQVDVAHLAEIRQPLDEENEKLGDHGGDNADEHGKNPAGKGAAGVANDLTVATMV